MSRRTQSYEEARYFTKKFNYYLQEWMSKDKANTKKLFLDLVSKEYTELHPGEIRCPGYSLLRKWQGLENKDNPTFPSDYIDSIAAVFKVPAAAFSIYLNPEIDISERNQCDKNRLDFAERIGLDKYFMLFILNTFSAPEFASIKDYDRLKDLLGDEPEFDDYTAMSLSPVSAETLLYKFRGLTMPEGVEVISNLYGLPCKRDLLYMKILQDKYASFLKIEVHDLASSINTKTKETVKKDHTESI